MAQSTKGISRIEAKLKQRRMTAHVNYDQRVEFDVSHFYDFREDSNFEK